MAHVADKLYEHLAARYPSAPAHIAHLLYEYEQDTGVNLLDANSRDWYADRLRASSGELGDLMHQYWTGGGGVLEEATLWLDPADLGPYSQSWPNRGTGGSALNAIIGSLRGAEILPDSGGLYLPGVASNYASVPDEAALDITGDIEMVVIFGTAPDWTVNATASNGIIGKEATAQRSYVLRRESGTRRLQLGWTTDGSTLISKTSSADVPSDTNAVKVTHDVDNGATQNEVKFYTSNDSGQTWSQLGSTQTTAGTTSHYSGTATAQVGVTGSSSPLESCVISRAIIRNGIGGSDVLDIDFTAASVGVKTFTCTTGQTVTVNTATDAAEPKILPHSGTNYVYTAGATGNYLSVADAAALDITGDITFIAHVNFDDWTPTGTTRAIFGKHQSDSDTAAGAYGFQLGSDGKLGLRWFQAGTLRSATSSVAPTVNDGESLWIAATIDVDNGSGQYDARFFTSTDSVSTSWDSVSWSQLGSTQTGATGPTSIQAGTRNLGIGGRGNDGSNSAHAHFYKATLCGAVGSAGVPATSNAVFVFDAATDVTSGAATSFTATSGQTVTVNRSSSGRKCVLVTRPTILFGTDDYIRSSDNDLFDFDAAASLTATIAVRQWGTPPSSGRFLTKWDGTTGWKMQNNGTAFTIYGLVDDGPDLVDRYHSSWSAGTRNVLGMVLNRGAATFATAIGGTLSATASTSAVGDMSNTNPLAIAESGSGSGYNDMECGAVAIWRRALSSTELTAIATYEGTI